MTWATSTQILIDAWLAQENTSVDDINTAMGSGYCEGLATGRARALAAEAHLSRGGTLDSGDLDLEADGSVTLPATVLRVNGLSVGSVALGSGRSREWFRAHYDADWETEAASASPEEYFAESGKLFFYPPLSSVDGMVVDVHLRFPDIVEEEEDFYALWPPEFADLLAYFVLEALPFNAEVSQGRTRYEFAKAKIAETWKPCVRALGRRQAA